MEEKIRYLRSIGVDAGQLAMVITRLPQLLSLDIANNMAPKFEYLCSELGRGVQDVASYPAYFSLSMPQRCVAAPPTSTVYRSRLHARSTFESTVLHQFDHTSHLAGVCWHLLQCCWRLPKRGSWRADGVFTLYIASLR